MLTDVGEEPDQLLTGSGMSRVAEQGGFVALAAKERGRSFSAWADGDAMSLVREAIQDVRGKLCIDPERIYLVGHGIGAPLVERAACNMPEVRAIATFARRSHPGETLCEPAQPLPHIHIAPLHDPYHPVRGGTTCTGAKVRALEEQEQLYRERNGCDETAPRTTERKDGECFAWTCETPFESCHINGGGGWADSKLPALEIFDCKGVPATFPVSEVIWDFFERIGSTPSSNAPDDQADAG